MSPVLGVAATGEAFGPTFSRASSTTLSSREVLVGRADGSPCLDIRPLGLQAFRDQESQLERLARIQPRIAMRVVAVGQCRVADRLGTAGAFGDVLPRHLEMHAA